METMPGKEETFVEHMRQISANLGAFDRGCRPHPGYLGTTLYWLAQTQKMPAGATASFLPDYVVARLTDTQPVTDATNAAGSGLFDSVDRKWHLALLAHLNLSENALPKIKKSGDCAGCVTKGVSDVTGLRTGTPVYVACGDNQASFAGSVGNYENSVLVNVGTGGQVSAYVSKILPTVELEARPFMDGGFLLVGAGLVGGRSYAWLRDFFRGVGQAFFGARGDEDLYEMMNKLAADVPKGSDGLHCEPLFTGTRREPNRRGIWQGVSTANFTPGHMARALLEGLAEQFARLYGEMESVGAGGRTRLIGAGNGIRKNALLRQIVGDRFGLQMAVPKHTEEAAFGAALIGAIGNGTFADIKEAGRLIQYK
jgi:sugar (pentulose or hexulose) kinase